jgi:hypothetical protein
MHGARLQHDWLLIHIPRYVWGVRSGEGHTNARSMLSLRVQQAGAVSG